MTAITAALTLLVALAVGGATGSAAARSTAPHSAAVSTHALGTLSCVTCLRLTYSGTGTWSITGTSFDRSGSQSWNETFGMSVAGNRHSGYSFFSGPLLSTPSLTGSCTGANGSSALQPFSGQGSFGDPTLNDLSGGSSPVQQFSVTSTELGSNGNCQGTAAGENTENLNNTGGQVQLPFASTFSLDARTWLAQGAHSETIPVSYSYTGPTPDEGIGTFNYSWSGTVTVTESQCDTSGQTPAVAHIAGAALPSIYLNGKQITDGAKINGMTVRGDTVQNVLAGQQLNLAVECDGKRLGTPTWKIQGMSADPSKTSVLGSYDLPDKGTFARAKPVNTKRSRITVHFMHASRKGFTVTATVGGQTATAVFIVTEPKVFASSYRSCNVGLTKGAVLGDNSPLFDRLSFGAAAVALGRNIACPYNQWDQSFGGYHSGNPGVEWLYAVHADSGQDGTLAMVQQISTRKTVNGTVCERVSSQGDITALYDAADNPGRAFVKAPADHNTFYWDRDSPGLSLISPRKGGYARVGTWQESFAAADALMWKSDRAGSVWVPLGGATWAWSASVHRSRPDQGWKLLAASFAKPTFKPHVGLPTFTRSFNPATSACNKY